MSLVEGNQLQIRGNKKDDESTISFESCVFTQDKLKEATTSQKHRNDNEK